MCAATSAELANEYVAVAMGGVGIAWWTSGRAVPACTERVEGPELASTGEDVGAGRGPGGGRKLLTRRRAYRFLRAWARVSVRGDATASASSLRTARQPFH